MDIFATVGFTTAAAVGLLLFLIAARKQGR